MRLNYTLAGYCLAAVCLLATLPARCVGANAGLDKSASSELRSGSEKWQGVMPQPSAKSVPRQRTQEQADGRPQGRHEGGDLTEQIESLKQQLEQANMRAQASAKRAEAANFVARNEMEKATQSKTEIKEARKRSAELVSEHHAMELRVGRYEAEIQNLTMKLQLTEQRLSKAEAMNRELTSQKAGLESSIQRLQQEHAVLLRRESTDKDMLRRAAEIVAREAEQKATAEQAAGSSKSNDQHSTLGLIISSWLPADLMSKISTELGKSADYHRHRAALLWQDVSIAFHRSMLFLFGKYWKSARKSMIAFSARAGRDAKRLSRWMQPLVSAYSTFEMNVGKAAGLTSESEIHAIAGLLALSTGLLGLFVIRMIFSDNHTKSAVTVPEEQPHKPVIPQANTKSKASTAPSVDSAVSAKTAPPLKLPVGEINDTATSGTKSGKLILPAKKLEGTVSKQALRQRKK